MRHLPLACLLLLIFALPAVADDGPAVAEKEAKTFASVAESWPAPAADKAFELELVVILGESPMGTYKVGAAPHTVDGKVVGWKGTEDLALEFGANKAEGKNTFIFGADLAPMKGDATDTFSGRPKKQGFTVKDGMATVTTQEGDAEATTVEVKVAPWMLPGKIGLFMAARFLPNKAATYKGMAFSHTDDDGVSAEFTLEVDPEAQFEGKKVMALRGERRDERIELLVDPSSRALLRLVRTSTNNGMKMTMKPRIATPAKPAGKPLFEREPENAAEVSAHVLYAVTVKDRALVEKLFRWSTMYEATKKQVEAAGQQLLDFEPWKKKTLDGMVAGAVPEGTSPEQLKSVLSAFVSKVQSQKTPEGWTAVVWPKDFARILVVLEEKDDGWKAIGMRNLGG